MAVEVDGVGSSAFVIWFSYVLAAVEVDDGVGAGVFLIGFSYGFSDPAFFVPVILKLFLCMAFSRSKVSG